MGLVSSAAYLEPIFKSDKLIYKLDGFEIRKVFLSTVMYLRDQVVRLIVPKRSVGQIECT